MQSELESSYDRVAGEFAEEFFHELDRKPFDCRLLDEFAATKGFGPVLDIGCGPGQIARYLRDRGVEMRGVDLSAEMIKNARRLNPDILFDRGNMLALELPDNSLAAIVSFYAIIHIERASVVRALQEMNRVLRPQGKLLLSFHGGEGKLHRDQWYEKPVSIDVNLFSKDEMAGYLQTAGFAVEHIAERTPYDFEYPTPRIYVRAKSARGKVLGRMGEV